MSGILRFDHVTKRFGALTAVDDVTLEIPRGGVFSLLGPSGCGKTTLLRMAAGFERPDTGRIWLDDRDLTEIPPERRPVNTVFQHYALFPHLSVWDNVAFGLKMTRQPQATITREVARLLEMVDLTACAGQKPSTLSGGQKQRVGIARALANRPEVLLLDEPLAALDLKLRQRLLAELNGLHEQTGITFLYVTHDQSEAMSISDHMAVMHAGRIEQIGTPGEIYESPRTAFVAAFIGDTNFFGCRVTGLLDGGLARVDITGLGAAIVENANGAVAGDRLRLSVRPEKLVISSEQPSRAATSNIIGGVIEEITYFGTHTCYAVRCGELRVVVQQAHGTAQNHRQPMVVREHAWLAWNPCDARMIEAEPGRDVFPKHPRE